MPPDSVASHFGLTVQIVLLDLLLSGDNALIIALACRALPDRLRRRAVVLGTGLAVGLRFVLTALAGFLLQVPLLKMAGGLLLLVIAVKLLLGDEASPEEGGPSARAAAQALGGAVMMIVGADLMLSLDNVIALAAVAQGQWGYLLAGLALSVPLLMYGSLFIGRQLRHYPILVPAGSVLLGWLAGQLIVSDPIVADWVAAQVPALSVVAPLLCAIYAPLQARIVCRQRVLLTAPPALGWFDGMGLRLAGAARLTETSAEALPLGEAPPAPAAEPIVTAAPMVVPAVVHEAPVERRAPRSAKPRQDNRLPRHWRWLIGVVAVVGLVAVGWIVLHLLSQGVLPAPEHPPQ
ncbi:MAG: TerC family protein [Paludibacterium sp.]|uniref:TerC family protein n=1 Tax=Paludibacterium sp. TaxID=1917523 RepID=UPI0025F0173B|nr:TerC family protein [Paludibacterium sp.]MBV8049166.1 TerC family protein [Paludibacterium sp.]MBV8649305.1 TerC family protein [Paludibacterium sp.]